MIGGFAVYLVITNFPNPINWPWLAPAGKWAAIALLFVAFGFGLRLELVEPTHPTEFDRLSDLPFIQLLIGFAFGLVAGEWLNLPLLPGQLFGEDPAAARKYWGIILAVLALLGIFYPTLNQLGNSLTGASVTTPLGGLSLTIALPGQNSAAPTQPGGGSDPLEGFGVSDLLLLTPGYMRRDQGYDTAFLVDWAQTKIKNSPKSVSLLRDDLRTRRETTQKFVNFYITPLVNCIHSHLKIFNSSRITHDKIYVDIFLFQKLLKQNVAGVDLSLESAKELGEVLNHAAGQLKEDLHGIHADPKETVKCGTDADTDTMGARWDATRLDTTLPYLALSLAHIQAAIGQLDAAKMTVANWLDRQYGSDADSGILIKCGKEETMCPPDLVQGIRVALPPWYSVRGQFDLVFYIAHDQHHSTRLLAMLVAQLLETIDQLFSQQHTIETAVNWQRTCLDVKSKKIAKANVVQNDIEYESTARLMYTYGSMVDSLIFSLLQIDPAIKPAEIPLSGARLLKYAEMNATSSYLSCLEMAGVLPHDDVMKLGGQFMVGYGTLLARMALDGEIESKDARKSSLRVAKDTLSAAVDRLSSYANNATSDFRTGSNATRLEFDNGGHEALSRAQRVLRQLTEVQ